MNFYNLVIDAIYLEGEHDDMEHFEITSCKQCSLVGTLEIEGTPIFHCEHPCAPKCCGDILDIDHEDMPKWCPILEIESKKRVG